jgi:hypothetical protein
MHKWLCRNDSRRWLAGFLCYLTTFSGAPLIRAQVQDVSSIEVAVDAGMNRENTDTTPWELAVSVQDNNGRRLKGAAVIFQIPPGYGTFTGGVSSMTLITDDNGRAVARGFRRGNLAGSFQIAVTASYRGLSTSVGVTQVNPKPAFWATPKKWYVVGGAGAVAVTAIGIWLGTRGGDSTRITLGAGSVVPLR